MLAADGSRLGYRDARLAATVISGDNQGPEGGMESSPSSAFRALGRPRSNRLSDSRPRDAHVLYDALRKVVLEGHVVESE